MAGNRGPHVAHAEFAILRELWRVESAAVRDLSQQLYGGLSPTEIATVNKLLARLERKGYVGRNRGRRAYRYYATVTAEEFVSSRLQVIADELCGGSLFTLVKCLVRRLNDKQRQRLRQLVEETRG